MIFLIQSLCEEGLSKTKRNWEKKIGIFSCKSFKNSSYQKKHKNNKRQTTHLDRTLVHIQSKGFLLLTLKVCSKSVSKRWASPWKHGWLWGTHHGVMTNSTELVIRGQQVGPMRFCICMTNNDETFAILNKRRLYLIVILRPLKVNSGEWSGKV